MNDNFIKETISSYKNKDNVEKPAGSRVCSKCKYFKPIFRNSRWIYDCEIEPMTEGEACPPGCSNFSHK